MTSSYVRTLWPPGSWLAAEEGGRPWETLRDLTEIGFAEWVSEARRTSGLRNDDVTLVHVDVW